jgi:hypothetical protein
MELASACSARQIKAVTPLKPDSWRELLRRTGLNTQYPTLVNHISFGFSLGLPIIHADFHPFNCDSTGEHHTALNTEFSKELAAKHYLGPFHAADVCADIEHFQMSPVSVIPKASWGHQTIQNFSYPYTPVQGIHSINSQLHLSDHPCLWGTFIVAVIVVSSLPPGSEIAVRDIKSVFRTIPVVPEEWPTLVVWAANPDDNDLFYIDTANSFGTVNGPGVYGKLPDAHSDVVRVVGMGPTGK